MDQEKPVKQGLALLGVNLTILMATLDVSIVNVALPTMVERMHTDFATVQWVIVSYMLVVTSLMLSVSRLGDMVGKKRLFLFGLTLFTIASLLCGLSPGIHWLIGFRAFQGVGAVMTQALGAAIIAEIVPKKELGRAMGWVGGTVALGLSAGPSLGGILIGLVGWRSIFLINVPIGLLAFLIVSRKVPLLYRPSARERFDYLGAVIIFVSLGSYALAMTHGQQEGFGQPLSLTLLAVAFVSLAMFLYVQKVGAHPMLDLSMFKNMLLSLNLCMGFLVFVGLGYVYIMPFFFKLVQGYESEEIGLLMIVIPLSMGCVAPFSGRLADRCGARVVSIFGLIVTIAGALMLSTIQIDTSWLGYLWRALPLGLGVGLFQAPNNSAIMSQAPLNRLGVVSGLMNYSRTIGQTTGIPLQGALFTAIVAVQAHIPARTDFSQAPPEALLAAFSNTFYVVALFSSFALVLAVVAYFVDKKREQTQECNR